MEVILAFRWYCVLQVFGLAALPLCLRLFRALPDRGYSVSKPLGLLLAGWIFWLLTTFGWLHNTVGGILVAIVLLVIAGVLLRPAAEGRRQLDSGLSWRTIAATEVVFTVAFAVWCIVRAHMPRIETAGGEKWMEITFLRAVLRSDTFPPHDPWLSGFAISYYYFGYVLVAMVTRLAAVPASIAFNLGIAALFALTAAGAFGLVHNLLALRGPAGGGQGGASQRAALLGGLLGPVLVTLMGNLEGLLEVLHARGIGSASFWRWLDLGHLSDPPPAFAEGVWVPHRFIWWWQASRVIRDYDLWGRHQEVIDEFPAFSFLLGDMHPHVLALPFVLLALALALNLYRRSSQGHTTTLRPLGLAIASPLALWEVLVYAVCLGGLGFLNTWDFPIYLFVVTAAHVVAHARIERQTLWCRAAGVRFASLFVAFLLLGFLAYAPFWIGFRSQAAGVLPNLFNGTRLPQFLVMFGPLAFVAAAFVAIEARGAGVRASRVTRWALLALVMVVAVLALVVGLVVFVAWIHPQPVRGPIGYVQAWLRGDPLPGLGDLSDPYGGVRRGLMTRVVSSEVLDMTGARVRDLAAWAGAIARCAVGSPLWTVFGLFVLVVAVVMTLARGADRVPAEANAGPTGRVPVRDFVLLLIGVGAALVLSVEFIYLRDLFGTRMNTVFKFYLQAWVMWAVAGAYALAIFIWRPLEERGNDAGRIRDAALALGGSLLAVAGLIYLPLAIPKRYGEYGGALTLDGAAYIARWQPDDFAAIRWLNANVGDAPVILEAPGGGYQYEGRVSAHTGLPTVLGWANHEAQWRGSRAEQDQRNLDIETIYASADPAEVLTLLDKYGISYVYVGPVERERYAAAGLAKFASVLDVAYDSGLVTIYRR